MKHIVLLGMLLGLSACQLSADVSPAPLTSELSGTYQTNGFLDYRRLTQSVSQMPTVAIYSTSASNVTITITQSFPKPSLQTITDVTLVPKTDQSIELLQAGQVIGTLQTGRIFTASGMSTQGRLLQLTTATTNFVGYRP